MGGITFDWSLRVGDIMTVGGFIGVGFSVFSAMRSDLRRHGEGLATVQQELVELRKVVVEQARANTRLDAHEKRLDTLEKSL